MDPLDDRLVRAGEAWRTQQPPPPRPVIVPPRAGLLRSLLPSLGFVAGGLALVAVLWVVIPRGEIQTGKRLASPSPAPAATSSGRTTPFAIAVATGPVGLCAYVAHEGRLVRDRASGLGIERRDGVREPIRWPFGSSAEERDGRVILLGPGDGPMAAEGDHVDMGDAGWDGGMLLACQVRRIGDDSSDDPATPLGDLATVTIRESWAGGAIYMEGTKQTLTVDGLTGRVFSADRVQTASYGSMAWPPGTYRLTSFVEPCDGNCDELDPPTDQCEATINLAAGDRVTVSIVRRAGEPCTIQTAPY